jgi:hypothetical protein
VFKKDVFKKVVAQLVFLAPLRTPVIALLGSLAGAFLTWLWFDEHELSAIVSVVVVLIVGLARLKVGAALLPGRPVGAVRYMNQTLIAYVVMLAVAAAAAIVVTVALIAQTDAGEETKKLLSAVTTVLTTFLGAFVIAGDKSDSVLGEAIKKEFYEAYGRDDKGQAQGGRWFDSRNKRLFPIDSDGVNALYGEGWHDIAGWDSKARMECAKAIAQYMVAGNAPVEPVVEQVAQPIVDPAVDPAADPAADPEAEGARNDK